MIKANVFKALAEPWYETPWRHDKRGYIGEDVFFCRKARSRGNTEPSFGGQLAM